MVVGRQQTLVQLSDELLALIDQQAAKDGTSRSELIRRAIEAHLADTREAEIDRAIIDGYQRIPQEPDPWAEATVREQIAQEPW